MTPDDWLHLTTGWADLSDGELRLRLRRRGVRSDLADNLVMHREESWAATNIGEVLSR